MPHSLVTGHFLFDMEYKRFIKKERNNYNTEGIKHLYWELFDSPDTQGSGYRFMEREPVMILDDIFAEFPDWKIKVEVGYCSKIYGDILGLPASSPFRVGKAVRLRATSPTSRMFIIRHLILRGVTRIGVGMQHVYFDTDNYLHKDALYIQ
jgi:hypothetical protein